eukprot:Em0001g1401a
MAMNRVLVLGSGYVCGPLVEYLTREARVAVTIATNVLEQGYKLSTAYPNTSAIALNVKDPVGLERLVSNHDLVVSYVSPQLQVSIGEIRKKGVVRPTTKDVYVPILERLKLEGIEATVTKHRT